MFKVPTYCCSGVDCTCAGQPFWKEVVEIDAYYDRHWRVWVARLVDGSGDQIGEAGYGATKELASNDALFLNNALEGYFFPITSCVMAAIIYN